MATRVETKKYYGRQKLIHRRPKANPFDHNQSLLIQCFGREREHANHFPPQRSHGAE